ncbi:aminotransferase [Mucilaginibacter hurinus]|uniref:Aminotransferase n=1 Tax=Mucilaginibacter hurinus TaxID=2201324 RepID=A0A367GPG1_9SPHI|nr:DegT/DnrJ/EryC1/StrS family aminotransferase [Mucilaginibacter hurinus]RCH54573.1 aminotransferase [Mucilaginibacter hurinus]
MIPYEDLKRLNRPFEEQFQQRYSDFIKKGHYILGEELASFEKAFAAYHNVPHCIGVSNGLDALILSLKACRLPAGAEVIVPAHTYIATILAILNCQLKPVLIEPDINTYNIDPEKIEEAITANTKAIMVVHLYGKCCNMGAIMRIKQKYNLVLIEDCAQAHGAAYQGRLAGTFGEFGAFSFYPTKNLGALGDAGGVLVQDQTNAEMLLKLRNYGSKVKYYNDVIGQNARLDELQAAFLSVKLAYLHQMNAHRNKLANLYFDNLTDKFVLPARDHDYHDVFHIFSIRHPRRDDLQAYLLKHQIGTVIHYPVAPHRQKALKDVFTGSYPITEEIHRTTLSLPCSFCHTEDEVYQVIEVLNKYK